MVRPINDFETSDNYNPWGKGGAGAPLRDDHGNLLTQVNGRFNHDQLVRQYYIPIFSYFLQSLFVI